jgi:o-succinylbenzoate---CoA ligase
MKSETVPNFLTKRAFLTPDRTAINFKGQSLTFKELYDQSLNVAGKLTLLGLKKDQYIGVLLKNHLDTTVILLALQLLAVKAVILNNRLSSEELAWQLSDSKSAFLLSEGSFHTDDIKRHMDMSELPIIHKETLNSIQETMIKPVHEIDLIDVCTVMYTSGTTGHPKGVLQTYGNHWWSAIGSALNMGLTEKDCWLCAVPLFHISGYSILMRSIIYGVPMILHEAFDEETAFIDIVEHKVTIMSVVGTMLSRLIEILGEKKLPDHFRCMLLGGGPAALPLLEACKEKGIPIYQTYGMTETASQIATLSPEYSISKLGSAGKPLFPSQLKIELPSGIEAGPGEAGEIVVKGPNVTSGYMHRPEETSLMIRKGWLYTGDIGNLDGDGFLYVLDRRSDLIISGGENIYPAEIESVLIGHRDVADAGVIGITDEKWGQIPVAFIVLFENAILTGDELLQYCLERLAKYKVPKKYRFMEELPRNAAKKLMRRQLREYL